MFFAGDLLGNCIGRRIGQTVRLQGRKSVAGCDHQIAEIQPVGANRGVADNVGDRTGFASASGFKAVSPTDFAANDKITIHLFGIEPCDGEMVNRRENFAGSCADYAERGLATLLKSPKVIYCRAFVSEANAPVQDATCYGYYNYPGSLDTVDMFEEQLVSLGTHRIAKKADGSLARPDLEQAEKIGRGGYGMWADPRIKAQ